ncbi:unnamed protein product [Gemmata massiliana]|uniref:Uncharacterized protein n=1 Tax=Gemmata massiliana TaxID=1210884 RepID=A0A6P2DGG7_9BACT|nr:hypothetical protein [Gemmata massiliana]VTS00014.1 unnamed protein product [Gemmata massiliana]
MSRTAAVVLLLLVPAIARADAAPIIPGFRTVWIDVTFTVERDYPDFEFYLLGPYFDDQPEKLLLSPSASVRMTGGTGSRYSHAQVYAVRKSQLTELPGPPSAEWLRWHREGVCPEEINFRTALLFTDTRDRIEITYRVEVRQDSGHVVKIGENVGNRWVERGWIAAAIFVPLGIISLGLWRVRRVRRLRTP